MVAREWPRAETPEDKRALSDLVDEKRMADNEKWLAEEHAAYLGNDTLTGLKNRGAFDTALEQEIKLVHRGMPASLISIDIDHFKAINDGLGHVAGDEVLQRVAAILKESIREVDIAARPGGDELMVLLSGANISSAAKKAEEIRAKIETLTFEEYPGLTVTASLGVIELNDSPNIDEVKKLVDVELYRAKHNGRNRVEVQGIENIT